MKIFSLILDHPKKTVFFISIITSLFCISIFDLSYDFTIEQLFAKDKQETEQYFDFQNEFSREDNVFLLVHKNPPTINYKFLDSLSVLVRQLKASSFFIDIVSLAEVKRDEKSSSNDSGFDHISSRLLNMFSKDSLNGAIWLTLKDEYNTFGKRADVIQFLKNTTAEYNWGWTFSGLPVVRNTYVDYMI